MPKKKSKRQLFKFSGNEISDILKCGGCDRCLAENPNYTSLFKKEYNNYNLINVKSIKRLGHNSSQGFILELQYIKDGFDCNSLLKCARKKQSDNLVYEYLCGKMLINELIHTYKFSCFIETYDLFKFDSKYVYDYFAGSVSTFNIKLLSDHLSKSTVDDSDKNKYWCESNELFAILIQNIPESRTFDSFFSKLFNDPKGVEENLYNLVTILCQIYFPLYILRNCFTHHDLHLANVILMEAPVNKIYSFSFNINGVTHRFKSNYLAKIIDYGRATYVTSDNLFNDDDSNQLQKQLEQDCGISIIKRLNKIDSNNNIPTNINNIRDISFINPYSDAVIFNDVLSNMKALKKLKIDCLQNSRNKTTLLFYNFFTALPLSIRNLEEIFNILAESLNYFKLFQTSKQIIAIEEPLISQKTPHKPKKERRRI